MESVAAPRHPFDSRRRYSYPAGFLLALNPNLFGTSPNPAARGADKPLAQSTRFRGQPRRLVTVTLDPALSC
jgi:hypothetical protein